MSLTSVAKLVCVVLIAIAAHETSAQTIPAPMDRPGYTAASKPSVRVDRNTFRNFDAVMQSLSQQGKIAIFVEGRPLFGNLGDEESTALETALKGSKRDLMETVTQIASAFDYDAEKQNSQAIVLRKRYSNPLDLPCVTREEVIGAAQGILKLTGAFLSLTPGNGYNEPCLVFARSLSAEQLSKAHDSLSVSEITPDQRELLMAATAQTGLWLQTRPLRDLVRHLQALDNKATVFTWMTVAGRSAFGYRGPFAPNGGMWDFPVSNRFRITVGGGNIRLNVPDANAPTSFNLNPVIPGAPYPPDATEPTDTDLMLYRSSQTSDLYTMSLRQAVSLIPPSASLPAGQSPASKISLSIDEAVADKPVTIFGAEYCSADHFVRSLASVYGLKLRFQDDSHYAIGVPKPLVAPNLVDLPSEISKLVPLPLARSFAGQRREITLKMDKATSEMEVPKGHERAAQAIQREQISMESATAAANAYYYPAIRRLQALARPRVPAAQSTPVPISDVGSEAYRIITIAMLAGGCMSSLHDLSDKPLPKYLTDPDSMCFCVRFPAGGKTLQISFGYRDAEGKFKGEIYTTSSLPKQASPELPTK